MMSTSLKMRCQSNAPCFAHRSAPQRFNGVSPVHFASASACSTSSSTRVLPLRSGRVLSVECNAKHEKEQEKKHTGGDVKGLKKEHKKLADTLKTHRKRLERLSEAYATTITTDAMVSTALLQDVLAELQNVKQLLSVRMMEDEESSSSSESEEEEYDTRMDWKQRPTQASTATAAAPHADAITIMSSSSSPTSPGLLVHTLHGDLEVPSSPRLAERCVVEGGAAALRGPSSPAVDDAPVARVVVCQGSKCADRGAAALLASASQVAASYDGMVELTTCKCLGRCKEGPAMKLQAAVNSSVPPTRVKALPRSVHTRVQPGDVRSLVAAHLEMQQQAMAAPVAPPHVAAEGPSRPLEAPLRPLSITEERVPAKQEFNRQQAAEGWSPVADLLKRHAAMR